MKFLGGGMSHVYMARDTVIGRTVAVKILTDQGAADEDTRARFIREAQLAGNVLHENIIRVYQFDEEAGRYYMVMEFLEGEDLNDAIRNGRVGGLNARLDIALQIARAMEYVHTMQIVHRDLKPHNIYLTKAGVAKLMDFGIAKTDQTSLTRTGYAIGTPSYMAPEQVRGGTVNHLSDIYAFGILLFEMLTGAKAFTGETVDRVFWQILNEPVNGMQLREAGVPERVIKLIARCTEKDQAARPQNFAEVRQELEAVCNRQAGPVAAPPGPIAVKQPGPKWLIPGVAVLAVMLLAAIGFFVWRSGNGGKEAPPPTPVVARPAATLKFPSGEMVLVPAGPFLFGVNKESRELGDYYIDRDEVTNAVYEMFLKATGTAAPPEFAAAKPNDPVENVTIEDARAFASWAGKRLPNSAEWEKAAGIAGVRQMSGGFFELVDEHVTPSAGALNAFAGLMPEKPTAAEPWCMLRGGRDKDNKPAPVYESGSVPERFRGHAIGFRCARDAR